MSRCSSCECRVLLYVQVVRCLREMHHWRCLMHGFSLKVSLWLSPFLLASIVPRLSVNSQNADSLGTRLRFSEVYSPPSPLSDAESAQEAVEVDESLFQDLQDLDVNESIHS